MLSATALLFALALSPQKQKVVLSEQEISTALTLFRYDDRCTEEGACPMINIHHVDVRNPRCVTVSAREHARYHVEGVKVANCTFESRVRFAGNVGGWRRDKEVLVLEPGRTWSVWGYEYR
ncbi:hypothetical protein TPR58_20815 [Sphingomonas sp. HF-S3]|uniref:Secreted protein n=1 Tax=Sphingomonas rustica TaxID=3103142 RepID=A0ABV0BDK9_9SPHN